MHPFEGRTIYHPVNAARHWVDFFYAARFLIWYAIPIACEMRYLVLKLVLIDTGELTPTSEDS